MRAFLGILGENAQIVRRAGTNERDKKARRKDGPFYIRPREEAMKFAWRERIFSEKWTVCKFGVEIGSEGVEVDYGSGWACIIRSC